MLNAQFRQHPSITASDEHGTQCNLFTLSLEVPSSPFALTLLPIGSSLLPTPVIFS